MARANCCHYSLKKSDVSDSLFRSQKTMFLTVFNCFSPFYAYKSESLPSLFAPSLFLKECQERFTPITLYKRATTSHLLFSKSNSLYRSFAHKNRAICLKNPRANSQPWSKSRQKICAFKTIKAWSIAKGYNKSEGVKRPGVGTRERRCSPTN